MVCWLQASIVRRMLLEGILMCIMTSLLSILVIFNVLDDGEVFLGECY